MTKKIEDETLLAEGKGYDEIQETTGAERSYIRNIAANYRKSNKKDELSEEDKKSDEESGSGVDNGEMDFKNDLAGMDNMAGDEGKGAKTGKEFHKAWVEAKAFECACGCTLNRRSKFCPNCGVTLDWSGF